MSVTPIRPCVQCLEEWALHERLEDEFGLAVEDCTVCHEPACEHHGQGYRDGWAHERCHEAPDMTRADDGEY